MPLNLYALLIELTRIQDTPDLEPIFLRAIGVLKKR